MIFDWPNMVPGIKQIRTKSSAETADVELQSRAGAREGGGGGGEVTPPRARRVRKIRSESLRSSEDRSKGGGSTHPVGRRMGKQRNQMQPTMFENGAQFDNRVAKLSPARYAYNRTSCLRKRKRKWPRILNYMVPGLSCKRVQISVEIP